MSLDVRNIYYKYPRQKDWVLEDFSLSVEPGTVTSLVGPSGYGKSTLGKIMAGQIRPSKGEITVDDAPIIDNAYCNVQLIYQHPELAVNPRWRMRKVLEEVDDINEDMMARLGVSERFLDRFPLELSGGELQRFCVLRALKPETRYIIADEISTMLDTITQAQIWNVILDFAREHNIGILAITHNENLAGAISDRIVRL